MHHVALNRSGPNDRDFDDDIVKTFRLHPRQRRHLRAALDLKHADRVGVLHHFERRRDRPWEYGRDRAAVRVRDKVRTHPASPTSCPSPSKIDFDDAEIFAIVLVPLRDDAAGHRRIFQRHDRAEFALANNHAAGMLAEMPRQSVDRLVKRDERRHARMRFRQTGLLDLRLQIERVRKIAVREEMREAIENVRRKIQRFADFARGAAAAISDHVRGHGRAVFAVTPVNFLDDALAPVAARQIEIDVGPAFPAFAQETFENEMIADRIDRRDAEAITNRAVRRAAASLHHDVVLPAEIDDVPDDQKITGKPELLNQGQLFFQLAVCTALVMAS